MDTPKSRNRQIIIGKSVPSKIMDGFIYAILGLIALSTVLPFLYVFAGSFATEKELTQKAFFIIPSEWSLNAYKYAINTVNILMGLKNSVFITLLGTLCSMAASLIFAYPLSKPYFKGRNWMMNLVVFTMLFSGGMIPSYLVYTAYGLHDTWWALILPGLISPFNMIIIKRFFQELPSELEEASFLDGASDMTVFFRIALPLSKPVIASISLFYAVGYWNDYFNAMIYLKTPAIFPVQIMLRSIILRTSNISQVAMDYYDSTGTPPASGVKMACTIIATLPILIVYPFIQKYFAKGVMVGALKG